MAEPAGPTGMSPESIEVDAQNLYREESYTDLKAATIRKLTPIKLDGSEDSSRRPQFVGDTTLMTQLGPIPVQFPIEADNLSDACEKFPAGVRKAIEQLNDRAREMAREEASRIVVPGTAPGGAIPGAGGLPGGGLPGGGKIQID